MSTPVLSDAQDLRVLLGGEPPMEAAARSRWATPFFRLARFCAVLAALIVAAELAVWGEQSDLPIYLIMGRCLLLIPVAIALHQLVRTRLSGLVLAVGLAGLLRYVAVAPLIALGFVSRYQEYESLKLAWVAYAGWLLGANFLLFRSRALPRWAPIPGLLAGALLIAAEAVWLQVAATGWRTDPSAVPWAMALQGRGNAFSMIGRFFEPFWLAAIAATMVRGAPHSLVGMHRVMLVEPVLVALLIAPTLYERPPALPGFDPEQYATELNVYDCSAFTSQAEAQAVLRANPADPNQLESRGGKGIACPGLPPPHDWIPVRTRGPAVEPVYANLVGRGTLAFVPLDDLDPPLFDEIVDYQEGRFGISIKRLPEVTMPWPPDDSLGELKAEDVIRQIRREFPDLGDDVRASIIAFTSRSLYQQRSEIESMGPFEHVYAHYEAGRLGVISTYDMEVGPSGGWASYERFISRVQYTTRYVGNLYFRIPRNGDPQSLFSRQVGSMADVDRWRDDLRRE